MVQTSYRFEICYKGTDLLLILFENDLLGTCICRSEGFDVDNEIEASRYIYHMVIQLLFVNW